MEAVKLRGREKEDYARPKIAKWVDEDFTINVFKNGMVLELQLTKKIYFDFLEHFSGKETKKDFKNLDNYTKYFITNSTDGGNGHVMFCLKAAEYYCEKNQFRLL